MTLEEARRLITGTVTAESARSPAMQAGAADAYSAGDPVRKHQLAEAMWTLLDQGDDGERELASYFFTSVTAPEDVQRRIVDAYVTRGWDAHDPSARTLEHFVGRLSPAEVQALRGCYLADPLRHPHLPAVLLRTDDEGMVWGVLAAQLEKSDDPAAFRRAYNAVLMAPHRAPDFYALLARRGEEMVRAVAARLTAYMARKLLAGCGVE